MKRLFIIAIVASLSLASFGCGEKTEPESPGGYGPAGAPTSQPSGAQPPSMEGIVNTKCPILGEDVDPAVTVEFQGKKVGFCCKKCIAKWEALGLQEKLAKLK